MKMPAEEGVLGSDGLLGTVRTWRPGAWLTITAHLPPVLA